MFIKLGILFLVFAALFFLPDYLPRLFGFLGRRIGQLSRLGKELVTGNEVPDSVLAEIEAGAGELLLIKALSNSPRSPKSDQTVSVDRIGAQLASKAKRQKIPYRFIVVDDPTPNACAIPGGSILVTDSLLDICSSPNEIAGVLAHEIQHIDCRHALNSLAKNFAVRKLLRIGGPMLRKAADFFEITISRGFEREQEFEADLEGGRLAKRAGFDPRGLASLLEKLAAMEPLENNLRLEDIPFFSSHPPMPERISKLLKRFG